MKKKLLLIGSLALIASFSHAQWVMQNTNFPNAVHGVASITAPAANVAWVAGYDGSGTSIVDNPAFSVTTDGGATWTAKKITASGVTTSFAIANISALDGATAYACLYDNNQSAGQGIYKTTDAGTTWTKLSGAAYGASSWPDLVHFFNANDGVAFGDPVGGYYEIYTTGDGGATWTRTPNTGNVLNPVPASEYGLANSFGAFGNTICVGTNHGRIFRSADKGITWTVSTTPLTSASVTDIRKIEFRDASNALSGSSYINGAATPVFTFIKSTDGGATWTAVTSTGAVFGADFCAVPGTTIYISSGADFTTPNQGTSMSADDGATWQLIEDTAGFAASTTGQRTALRFFSSTLGYAGGFTGTPSTTGGIFKWSGPIVPYVGTNDPSPAKNFVSVYPNPCSDKLAVSLKGVEGKRMEVKICNVLGETVYRSAVVCNGYVLTKYIDIRGFAGGMYFVAVSDGNSSITEKIIKE